MYNLNSIENNQSAIKGDTYFDAKGCFIVSIKPIFDTLKTLPAFSWFSAALLLDSNVGSSICHAACLLSKPRDFLSG